MPVPESDRVSYGANPVVEVSCRLRYPRILTIDVDLPAAFQERIRGEYPYYQQNAPVSAVKLPAGIPESVAKAFRRDVLPASKQSYVFASPDRTWTLELTSDSLFLSGSRYDSWEDFRRRLAGPFEALIQVYGPAFFTHVCVRYRNAIRRSRLALQDEPWRNLVQPWISGPLDQVILAEEVDSIQTRCTASLPNRMGKMDATYGLATEEPSKETVFLIETHVFTEDRTEQTDVVTSLDHFNRQARHFFRWCITDQLHRALEPVEFPRPGE